MTETQKLRIKSAMIIYELETSLGNYVIENVAVENISEKNKSSILKRETGTKEEQNNVSFLVESSYLDEVFNLAIDITTGTSLNGHMKQLKELCTYLGVFDIRNAISHPNRPFPDSFWFRAATIASDPLIEILGLGKVRQALNSAIQEKLSTPPGDWFDNVKWAIPNTLPTSFDHEITGLLGREKEFKDLYATLSRVRSNLIAVVAPGGIGKTALILQFLKEVSLTPKYSQKVNSIVFCTLKNERLTADGLQKIEAINGIEQIKKSILTDLISIYENKSFGTFDEACEELENEKVLICIDNLETLLVDSQREFIDFNQSLPLHWRVVVTSRISIDSATTVPLESLVKRHAINLCRNYFRKRGVQNIEQPTLEKIAEMSNNNPLAIRLTVDLYIKGADINKSISQSQKDIASFSYKNLIESIKDNSIAILEAIFVLSCSTKAELTDFLNLSHEEVSESINELSKTSLLIRDTDEIGIDSYKLSDSIRDLLLVNPKNIEVRSQISENLKKLKEKIQYQSTKDKEQGINHFDNNFVEPKTNRSIHALILDLNKYFSIRKTRNHETLSDLKNRFTDLIAHNDKDYQLIYHYSRVLSSLSDKTGELIALNKAKELNDNSPRIEFAIGKHHFYNGDYEKAVRIFNQLLIQNFENPEVSSRKFSYQLIKLNFLCLLYLHRYQEILEITNGWKDDKYWFNLYGTYRASTFKRQSENLKANIPKREKLICDCIDIFTLIFKDNDYPYDSCLEVKKILLEFNFILNGPSYSQKVKGKLVSFIANHYFSIVTRIKGESIDSKESKELLSNAYNTEVANNPLHSVDWYSENSTTVYDEEHISELIDEGYTIVDVYHIPERENGLSNYIFGVDDQERQFFLVVDNYDGGWNGWGFIEIDSKLAIKFDKISIQDKATVATEILDIDQYIV